MSLMDEFGNSHKKEIPENPLQLLGEVLEEITNASLRIRIRRCIADHSPVEKEKTEFDNYGEDFLTNSGVFNFRGE